MDLSRIYYVETPNVIAVTTTSSAATAINSAVIPGAYKFCPDADVWIKFGGATMDAPIIASTSGVGRCWYFPRGQEKLVYLDIDQQYLRVITSTDVTSTYLRWALEIAG
jgi:hypothetical protein